MHDQILKWYALDLNVLTFRLQEPPWFWSHDRSIYIYSIVSLNPDQARCTQYNIVW